MADQSEQQEQESGVSETDDLAMQQTLPVQQLQIQQQQMQAEAMRTAAFWQSRMQDIQMIDPRECHCACFPLILGGWLPLGFFLCAPSSPLPVTG